MAVSHTVFTLFALNVFIVTAEDCMPSLKQTTFAGNQSFDCKASDCKTKPNVTFIMNGEYFMPGTRITLDPVKETYSFLSTFHNPFIPFSMRRYHRFVICRVETVGNWTSDAHMKIMYPLDPDSVRITGNRQIIATGSNRLILRCHAMDSYTVLLFTWFRGSTVLKINIKPSRSYMELLPTRHNDRDVITCSVTYVDKDIAAVHGAVNVSVTLNLTYSPEIQSMTDITVDEGQVDVVLPCIVSSKPVSDITWYHDGSVLVQGEGTAADDGYNSLNYTLSRVSRYDQGTYDCNASNHIGDDLNSLNLTVRYVTVTATNTRSDFLSTTITCRLNNFGDSYVSQPWVQEWPGYGEVIRRPFFPVLTLTHLTYEFSGVYTCRVKSLDNGAVYLQDKTTLRLKSPPVILKPRTDKGRYKVAASLHNPTCVSVQYYSNVPGSDVKCYRSNNSVRSLTPVGSILLTTVTVQLPVFHHTVPTAGTTATVTIMVDSEDDFGDYDIVITNGIGNGSFLLVTVVPQDESLGEAGPREAGLSEEEHVGVALGVFVFGLVVGIGVGLLVQRFRVSHASHPRTELKTSGTKTQRKPKLSTDQVASTSFNNDAPVGNRLPGQPDELYEGLQRGQNESNYALLQTGGSEETYYNMEPRQTMSK